MKSRSVKKIKTYLVSIGIALAVGIISALLSMKGMKTFSTLKQPPLSPPGWLFPVVWSILYILMGISAAHIYMANTEDSSQALWIYAFQLIVNALWSPIFFSLGLRLVAFAWLLILLALVVLMTVKFKRIDAPAGNLQFPYIIWLMFAGYLNIGVYLLNG